MFFPLQWRSWRASHRNSCLPPRSGRRFFSNVFTQSKRDTLRFYFDAWKQCGDVVRFETPGRRWYLAVHPEAVRHVLRDNAANYRKPAVLLNPLRLLFGEGLLTTEGDVWKGFRRWGQVPFQHGIQQTLWKDCLAHALRETLSKWESKQTGEAIYLHEEMTALALKSVCYLLFGRETRLDFSAFLKAVRTALRYMDRRMGRVFCLPLCIPSSENRQFLRAKRILEDCLTNLFQAHRASPRGGEGLLAHLIASQSAALSGETSERQLRDLLLTLMIAAAKSLGTALCWAWLLLARHPAIERKLLDELDGVSDLFSLDGQEAAELSYARMIFQETLRLYPTAWVLPRQAIADDILRGFAVPRGTVMIVSQYLTHRHPDFWANPEAFLPERFAPEALTERNRLAYFPFGLGSHTCLGKEFILVAGPFLLAALARRYRLEPAFDGLPEMEEGGLFLEPAGSVGVILRERVRVGGAETLLVRS